MANFIPTNTNWSEFGRTMGQAAMSPLQEKFDMMAMEKAQNMQQRLEQGKKDNFINILESLNYDPKLARLIANVDPKTAASLLSNLPAMSSPEQMLSDKFNQLPMEQQEQSVQPKMQIGEEQPGKQMQLNKPQTYQEIVSNALRPKMTEYQERRAKAAEESAQSRVEKEKWQQQSHIRSLIHEEQEDYKREKEVAKLANRMMGTLKKVKNKWPNFFIGNMDERGRNLFIRDPEVRSLMAEANELMILKAQTRKGLPSNFKIKLEGLAKADVSQPYDTAESLIKDTLKSFNTKTDRIKYLLGQQKEDGTYPQDLETMLINYDLKHGLTNMRPELGKYSDPSDHPGKTIRNPATGEMLYSNGSEWLSKENENGMARGS